MPPPGFTYVDDFLTADQERAVIAEVERLPFPEVRMHGVVARRTVIHFGFDYDYEGWSIRETDPSFATSTGVVGSSFTGAPFASTTFTA